MGLHLEFEVPVLYQSGWATGRGDPPGERGLHLMHKFWRYSQKMGISCGHEVVEEEYVELKEKEA